MSWIYKAERKFGKYAVADLMKYVIGLKVVGAVIGLISPNIYYNYLSFNVPSILHGEVWRLFTFILRPEITMDSREMLMDLFLFVLWIYVYYFIGNAIERTWGTFRFNLYFFTGTFATVLFSFLYCIITGEYYYAYFVMSLNFLFQAMFLTFALMFPETSFMLYFIIPVKAKWLGYVGLAFSVYEVVSAISKGIYIMIVLFIVAYANFLFYYFMTNNPIKRARFFAQPTKKQKVKYKNTAFRSENAEKGTVERRHRCVVCGRTEKEDENLTFRYCSKCEGDYEYCSEHLFTHEHIKKN